MPRDQPQPCLHSVPVPLTYGHSTADATDELTAQLGVRAAPAQVINETGQPRAGTPEHGQSRAAIKCTEHFHRHPVPTQ